MFGSLLPPFDHEHLWFWVCFALVAIFAPELWK
jgi:hypothetical protein